MATFYFPPYNYGDEGYAELFSKLEEEVNETQQAIYNYEDSNRADVMRLNLVEELADVIHCAETIMRYYGVDYVELGDIVEFVMLKNSLRGYYKKDDKTLAQKNSVQS